MVKDKRKKFDYLISCCNYRNLSIDERQEHFIIKEYDSKFFCIVYKQDIESLTKYRQIVYLINDVQFKLNKERLKNGLHSNN